jgi:carboxypeptidase Taq
MNAEESLARLKALDADVVRLGHVMALLEWDQETYLPEAAARGRAAQSALLAGMRHDRIVDGEWGDLFSAFGLDESAAAGSGIVERHGERDAAFLREAHKRWRKASKVPKKLVEDLARETSLSQSAWITARKADDFPSFAPHLSSVISLEKEYASAVSPGTDPYDVLLDEYEPGATGGKIARVFDELEEGLGPLLEEITSREPVAAPFLDGVYPVDRQDAFGKRVQEFMGFDAKRGRLDLSAHPFTTTLGPDDVRVTTRYDERDVLSGLFSNIHEAGHGLYEQGMGPEIRGSLLADGAGLGIHESQSRFWENIVGRSRAFWDFWYGNLRDLFPDRLGGIGAEVFYRAVTQVAPSLIRVEADEVTYSYHIIIRFRLERALLAGDLAVDDLPSAWKDAYRGMLGVEPAGDADGCLQDVHWSVGLFGYFPTYALGNLYAAQFTKAMEAEIGPLSKLIRAGDAASVLNWLRRKIHIHGRITLPEDLCQRVSGGPLDPVFFLEYLGAKYRAF